MNGFILELGIGAWDQKN